MNTKQLQQVRELLGQAVGSLREAGSRDEALARYVPPQRRWVFTRRARLEPVCRVWRIGMLLANEAGDAWIVGTTTRVLEPAWPRNTALAIEERRRLQELAWNGPFERGDTVNFEAVPIDLSSGGHGETEACPFVDVDGEIMVRWDPHTTGTQLQPFAEYVAEQIRLRIDPFL
ncbi:hypothetical protein [Pseudoclavibacter sp. 13-3]|uniref:hypothetical protein n=1 Tax=Pseudoclavibacter sp. 13-3 TaxID=2901228 RepID=UPI001E36AE2A|nr:hypothetical protein [Pseudoclavibacter sp. 13-3]MCD7101642.1 hypothetical protein [Pseudoclavibacter sp. 13-3]